MCNSGAREGGYTLVTSTPTQVPLPVPVHMESGTAPLQGTRMWVPEAGWGLVAECARTLARASGTLHPFCQLGFRPQLLCPVQLCLWHQPPA